MNGLPVDEPAGLLNAVGNASAEHILLLAPLHQAADAREQAHVLLAADRQARVCVLPLPHHALTLALVADGVLRRPESANADPSTVWQLVRQSAARSRSLVWHPRLGGLADHARTAGELLVDLGRAPGWFCEIRHDGSFTVTPGHRGAGFRPGGTLLHAGEAPPLLASQLGEARAVPVPIQTAPAPYRHKRSIELTVLAAPALPTTQLTPCASCGAGLVDQQCPFCGHGPLRRPSPPDPHRSGATPPLPVSASGEVHRAGSLPAAAGADSLLVMTRGEVG